MGRVQGAWRDVLQGARGWPGVQGMATSARSKGLHGNKGKFVAERVKSRPVACRPLCLKRSLPAPTKQEQMVHCFKGFSETKEQDQITFPQRGYLQKAFALIKDASLFSSQHFIHHIGFWGGGEASIVYCASPSPPRDQEGISDDWAARPLSEVFYPTTYLFTINN